MFTGLVHGQGEVTALERRGGQMRLRLRPLFALAEPCVGESIAVNGTCLTLESWDASAESFTVYASMETVDRTSLGALRVGSRVNLERALALGERLGGHLVSGHVDTVAHVEGVRPAGDSRWCRLTFEPRHSQRVGDSGRHQPDCQCVRSRLAGGQRHPRNLAGDHGFNLVGRTSGQFGDGSYRQICAALAEPLCR